MSIISELDSNECIARLGSSRLGRIAFISSDEPVILPVNFVFHEGMIVFRTDPGEKLDEVPMRRVAFEIDGADEREAWSVLVRGHAREVTTALGEPYEALRALPVPIQAPGDKAHWIAIEIIELSGRVIR